MDIIFNCPKCEQELEVDSAGVGSEIDCPSCGQTLIIPQAGGKGVRAGAAADAGGVPTTTTSTAASSNNPIASSAAAKVEMHLKVPVHTRPSEMLIEKARPPLEVAAKDSDKKVRFKSIRHTDCIEVGHDRYDEIVGQFLAKVGETNIISINTFNYTHLDIGSQKLMTEYGVFIVYKG